MIIILRATAAEIHHRRNEYELLFDLPPLDFNLQQTVFVNEMSIKWKRPRKHAAVSLQCTLIDKSPLNPTQQLLFAYQNYESDFLFYSPTRPQEYKIQRSSLQSSQFTLVTSEKDPIQEVYIQLFISDARVQQIHQK